MTLEALSEKIQSRKELLPSGSYTTSLFLLGLDRIAQKVGEEAVEVVIAAKNPETNRQVSELADLFFHILVLMSTLGITLEDVLGELEERSNPTLGKKE